MNNEKVDICNYTLNGIFMSPYQKSQYNNAVTWAGNVYANRKNGFHRKRTFMSEWESAANNQGVFVNK